MLYMLNTGRKSKTVAIRLSDDEYLQLQRLAKEAGISVSTLVRHYIANGKTRSEEEVALLSVKLDLALLELESIKEVSLAAISAGASAEMSSSFKKDVNESMEEARERWKEKNNALVRAALDHGVRLNQRLYK